ncbi:2Fe-2S iron-sulfur cluster-binding protein [Sedimenticola sp.]|uniref:2Fe-2S iron-sulfur cluster-binding protein n=1 Tax=Sedimenticola sp. TaxID=1940285 RepID=UPI003D10D369
MSGKFTIDGVTVPFETGQSIMDAALAAKIYIPHLCHNPEFHPHGSCRLCCVNADGRTVAACTTPAAEGIQVENETHEITTQRRLLLKLLFVEGNHVCPACEKSGACQLQAVAYHCGMLAPEFVHFYPKRAVDASHPETIIDFNRCILCELCVRASREFDHKSVFNIGGRGIQAHLMINSPSGKLGDSAFSARDKAARVCPVGAILPKHRGYNVPIGKRLYDQESISQVGDVASHLEHDDDR